MTMRKNMLNGKGRRWLFVPAVVVAMVGTSASAQWAQFGGPGRDFKANAKSLGTDWEEGGPEVVWTEEVAMGASPVVVDGGIAFVTDRFGPRSAV